MRKSLDFIVWTSSSSLRFFNKSDVVLLLVLARTNVFGKLENTSNNETIRIFIFVLIREMHGASGF